MISVSQIGLTILSQYSSIIMMLSVKGLVSGENTLVQ
jgi:hypothetical protein